MNSRVVCGVVIALAITDVFAFHRLTAGYARSILGFEVANSKHAVASSVLHADSEHVLQRVCDVALAGGHLKDVEPLLLDIEADLFQQSSAWSNTWTPIRCVIAEVSDTFSLGVTALPGGTKLDWRRYHKAESVSRLLFGDLKVTSLELRSDAVRELDQGELEATYADAWAIGGSEENDCVCRGGRCPRMWDCPFWVDRRRKEAKGSRAHVAHEVQEKDPVPILWRAGKNTVRRIEALKPSALLEVRVGSKDVRHYQQITSRVDDAVELIEVSSPTGVSPGVCSYLGPAVRLVHH